VTLPTRPGYTHACVFIGCEHGKHRAVAVVERLGRELYTAGRAVKARHRGIHLEASGRGRGCVKGERAKSRAAKARKRGTGGADGDDGDGDGTVEYTVSE